MCVVKHTGKQAEAQYVLGTGDVLVFVVFMSASSPAFPSSGTLLAVVACAAAL